MIHIWKQKGWWYASDDKRHRRDGKVICGFQDLGAVFAKLRGGDEEVIRWSKENPPEWSSRSSSPSSGG